ncbi:MAG TPA: hypothetical protein VLL75_14020 [Vicinamibacteria bacterium]|nr:hypothetical protein [Vicinamibacteria bacterium]
MTRHLPDGSLLNLAEGRGSDADRAHAGACAVCAARLAEVRSALDLARRADVPEPSPLYWDAMRRSVDRRIGEEPRPRPRWVWLGPFAATAALVAALVLTSGRTHAPSPTPAPGLPAWSALPEAEDDPSLAVLEGLAAGDDALGALDEGGGVGPFLANLSDEDYQALAESLRGAGKGGES